MNTKEVQFRNHLNKFVTFNQEEFLVILPYFKQTYYVKKENLLTPGDKCNRMYFVTKGCLYMYTIDDSGTEKTIQFAIENWWLTDVIAFVNQSSASFGIRAALKSDVLEISFSNYQELLDKHPVMEKYFRNVNEIAYGAALMRFQFLFTLSKEDIYHHFNARFPQFVNRVPQYLLASYLNLTPEYLSQIRKKSLS